NGVLPTLPLICASLAVLLGLLTFAGWISGLPLLASVRAKYIPMTPSTALCFLVLRVGLIAQLLRPGLYWFARVLAAAAKLLEFVAGFHFGIGPAKSEK